jgi:membrane protease YdiL (CAAX protease family)
MSRSATIAIRSAIALVSFALIRCWVYYVYPAHDLERWFMRDCLMTIPRLFALLALLAINEVRDASSRWLHPEGVTKAALFGIVPMGLWLYYFSSGNGARFGPFEISVGFLTSLVVGGFEEYAFRGPLFSILRERTSTTAAIFMSSVLFMLFHVQAQPIEFWPIIFLMGIVFGSLRVRGMSIFWLSSIHAAIDTCYFIFPVHHAAFYSANGIYFVSGLFLYSLAVFPGSPILRVLGGDEPKPVNA